MMSRDAHPAFRNTTERMLSHNDIVGRNGEPPVQTDADRHCLSAQCRRNAVAVSPDVDVPIPAHCPVPQVRGVVSNGRQRTKKRFLTGKSVPYHLFDRTVDPLVCHVLQPPLRQAVHVGKTLKCPVTDKKVVLDIPDHPFVFPFRPRTVWTAGPGGETIPAGKIEKPLVKSHTIPDTMADHGAPLVVNQHFPTHAAKMLARTEHPLIGVLGVVAVGAPEMKPPGIPQGVDTEINFPMTAGNCRSASACRDRSQNAPSHGSPVMDAWVSYNHAQWSYHRCIRGSESPGK